MGDDHSRIISVQRRICYQPWTISSPLTKLPSIHQLFHGQPPAVPNCQKNHGSCMVNIDLLGVDPWLTPSFTMTPKSPSTSPGPCRWASQPTVLWLPPAAAAHGHATGSMSPAARGANHGAAPAAGDEVMSWWNAGEMLVDWRLIEGSLMIRWWSIAGQLMVDWWLMFVTWFDWRLMMVNEWRIMFVKQW